MSCFILGCLYHSTVFILTTAGVMLIAAAVYMLEVLPQYGTEQDLINFSIVTIIVGSVTIIMGTAMLVAQCTKHRCMLYVIAFIAMLIWSFQLSSLLWMGFQASTGRLEALSLKSYTNDAAYLNNVQRDFECCGVEGPEDWATTDWGQQPENAGKVPESCCMGVSEACDLITDEDIIFDRGCRSPLFHYLATLYNIIIGVTIIICLFQFSGIFLSCCVARALKEEQYQKFSDSE